MPRNYIPPNLDTYNANKQKRFLKVLLENGGFVEAAIREVHTSRRWLNDQLDNDEGFAELFAAIRGQNNEKIEAEVYRRGITGVDEPLVNKGVPTGHYIKRYSDNLLMFYAKANMPEKYRDLPQKGQQLTDEELDARIAAWQKKRGKDAPSVTSTAPELVH